MWIINLLDIPAEGKNFEFTRASGELEGALHDLVGKHDYRVSLSIRPMGNIFVMTGEFATQADELCARCGWELKLPLQATFQEYLVPSSGAGPRGSRRARTVSEGGSDYESIELQNEQFAVGEYLHELIALHQPDYPDCGDKLCPNLRETKQILARLEGQALQIEESSASVFAKLRDFRARS